VKEENEAEEGQEEKIVDDHVAMFKLRRWTKKSPRLCCDVSHLCFHEVRPDES
jgi:hypothetical protein